MLYLENIEFENFVGKDHEMEMVRYFLKNAPLLKKMSIGFHLLEPKGISYFRKLKKTSAACKIEVAGIPYNSKPCNYFYRRN